MDLDLIDAERGGPMYVMERRQLVVVPAASAIHWKIVATAITDPHTFATLVWPATAALTSWKLELAQQAWIRHNGLLDAAQVRRLVYMTQKYWSGIEYDLQDHLGLNAGELWRDRKWRRLLGYIDHLPTNSHMNRLLSLDEDYMEHLLRSKGTDADPGTGKPSMAQWGQLESMMATLIDAVNRGTAMQQAVANPKGAKPRIDPYPRPYTAAEKIRYKIQKEEHQSMVSQLLGNRSGPSV